MFPEKEVGGRGRKSDSIKAAETAGFSERRLREARLILEHSPAEGERVIAGAMNFDEALQKAQAGHPRGK